MKIDCEKCGDRNHHTSCSCECHTCAICGCGQGIGCNDCGCHKNEGRWIKLSLADIDKVDICKHGVDKYECESNQEGEDFCGYYEMVKRYGADGISDS